MKPYLILTIALLLVVACQQKTQETQHVESTTTNNMLTEEQKADGWVLLFDGKTTDGWRNFKSNTIGAAWVIDDEALHFDNTKTEGKGDIITDGEYENFELMLEWKIDSCGNSGIIFNVVEDAQYNYVWQTGPEMQVLDNNCHPDAKIIKHRAGDLYDLISCSTETVKPAGEWNQVRIVSDNGNYQFWLNGTNVVNFTMHTPEWDAMVAGSKFKEMPGFGKATKGHISLQDHGDKVWYRNIMIRVL
ncbi:MAG: DUF1080 domain-containing protein [Cyclobacteriaceae bacterium]|nr:DUF1080 domain-containing protein [Cyclobacteriaceae bacterium]UYN87683.1 MAG: DUF1080 domain-containing protein [Cyclobacteriaceae bacterium]